MSMEALTWLRTIRVTLAQKAVLFVLADRANEHGEAWPGIETISFESCAGERTVQDALRSLEVAGLIRLDRMKRKTITYFLQISTPQEPHPAGAAPRRSRTPRGPRVTPQEPHPPGAGAAPKATSKPHEATSAVAVADGDPASIDAGKPTQRTIFRDGLAIFQKLTGKTDKDARALLVRLLRTAKEDHAAVLAALDRAEEVKPVDPVPWLIAAVKPRDAQKSKPEPAKLPDEVNGFVVPAVVDGVLDALDVGDLRFPALPATVFHLLRDGHEPDELYAAARSIARGGVDRMRSAGLLVAAVRSRARERREQSQELSFNLDMEN